MKTPKSIPHTHIFSVWRPWYYFYYLFVTSLIIHIWVCHIMFHFGCFLSELGTSSLLSGSDERNTNHGNRTGLVIYTIEVSDVYQDMFWACGRFDMLQNLGSPGVKTPGIPDAEAAMFWRGWRRVWGAFTRVGRKLEHLSTSWDDMDQVWWWPYGAWIVRMTFISIGGSVKSGPSTLSHWSLYSRFI